MLGVTIVLSKLLWMFSSFTFIPSNLCQIYGPVYVTDNPAEAQYFVYLEKEPSFADLVVYLEENQLFADKEGVWYYAKNRSFAKHIICFTENRSRADFSIAYTDAAVFAGCN
jgi:hypothetical protein